MANRNPLFSTDQRRPSVRLEAVAQGLGTEKRFNWIMRSSNTFVGLLCLRRACRLVRNFHFEDEPVNGSEGLNRRMCNHQILCQLSPLMYISCYLSESHFLKHCLWLTASRVKYSPDLPASFTIYLLPVVSLSLAVFQFAQYGGYWEISNNNVSWGTMYSFTETDPYKTDPHTQVFRHQYRAEYFQRQGVKYSHDRCCFPCR